MMWARVLRSSDGFSSQLTPQCECCRHIDAGLTDNSESMDPVVDVPQLAASPNTYFRQAYDSAISFILLK